jgi:hypothetical protein
LGKKIIDNSSNEKPQKVLGKNRKQGRKKKWITKLFRNSRNNPKKR